MTDICAELHCCVNKLPHLHFPFNEARIPKNGIYILFEEGETAHGTNRIVRVGTHTGEGKLASRLREHFIVENKDRSIFRKNIGRALLNKAQDPFLSQWEIDLTTRAARDKFEKRIDQQKLKEIEHQVTECLRSKFFFVVIPVPDKADRMRWESRLISTISLCRNCHPSPNWLGLSSPRVKIREKGLWNSMELFNQPMNEFELYRIKQFLQEIVTLG